jgi:hypothetical protein
LFRVRAQLPRVRSRFSRNFPKKAASRSSTRSSEGARPNAAIRTQVRRQGFANITQKGQLVHNPALAANDDFGVTPAEIIQFQRDDLARTQTEAGKEKQNGIIAASSGCRSIRRRQYACDLFWREKSRRSGIAIFADPGNGKGKIAWNLAR